MKYGSLFSGIEGFGSGFDAAGFDCAWQCEIEPSCISVLERHYPNVKRYTDVRAINPTELEPVDVICGGFPCQDLSVAGKRAGLAGERSRLWFDFHRIVAGTLPRWVVIENVLGLLSSNGGRDFGVIVRGLLDIGYRVAWRVLDAQYFGVAQRRRRVFIVGSLGDGSCAQILFESQSSAGDSPPRRETRARVAACIDGSPYADREAEHSRLILWALHSQNSGAMTSNGAAQAAIEANTARCLDGGGGFTASQDGNLIQDVAFGGNNTQGEIDVATACNAHGGTGRIDFESETFVAAPLTAGMSATPGVNRPGRRREDDENLVCATLNSAGNNGGFRTEPGKHLVTHPLSSEGADASEEGTGRGTPLVAFNIVGSGQEGKNHAYETDVTGAIQHKGNSASGNEAGTVTIAGGFGVRRLTPTECERLMGLLHGWTALSGDGKPISDSARYRMLGNAVVKPVATWIAKRILAVTES